MLRIQHCKDKGIEMDGFDIRVGTLFYGRINSGIELFLRIYQGIVSLGDPGKVCIGRGQKDFPTIQDYREVDGLLTVEG